MPVIDVHSSELVNKVNIIKVLAHPIRYAIAIALYENGTMNVGAIQETLDLAQSTVSQHISKMREIGVVTANREGTKIFYELTNDIARNVVSSLESE
ncbi:transcriptional regulator [Suicoccus acidiformans]|uniref:Transcriptional regulator n=1 Tax=Suicoccus acidiformans TaxID=2036206 RepID=A0A347WMR2_9LACT|nr:metalloregulator ArsR/SmtB family transcription factor [Suicoccus acidiformans]AXY26369.1 transcriptional regulator [Suicoccus acidiformans]